MNTTPTSTEIQVVHRDELHGERISGGRLRAFCPIHGSDHQQSLSIQLQGEYAGYGRCHACQARVFVPELNPDAAAGWERRREQRVPLRPRKLRSQDLLRPPRRPVPAPTHAQPQDWQREELAALARLYERMRVRLADERPRAYLEARAIPFDVAEVFGVGYIPADARLKGSLAKWRDRLMFPLGSPDGGGFIGRSLHGWQPGMDENAHKAFLEDMEGAPRRWEKTYPAGWLGYAYLATVEHMVLVEGPFDAMALFAAGMPREELIALVGTAGDPSWIPSQVRSLVLALDGDVPGNEAWRRLAYELSLAGLEVIPVAPAAVDGKGKDWAERWRLAEWGGVMPVFDARELLELGDDAIAEIAAEVAPLRDSAEDHEPWLHNPIVRELQRMGYELIEARVLEEVAV